MPDVTFTNTITVQVLDSHITAEDMLWAQGRFEVTAPLTAWQDHTDNGFTYEDLGGIDEPLFYLPDPDPRLDNPQHWLLRGTLEALAETGWEAYTALLDAGLDPVLARAALPGHFMLTRIVAANGLTLARFVDHNRRYVPGKEVAVIAGGYAAHLAEVAPDSLLVHRNR